MKSRDFDELIEHMGKCQKCLNMHKGDKDCSLINIYEKKDFAHNIPSIWTDWSNRLDADIMIIGQDWGPFADMQRLNQEYLKNLSEYSWKALMESEKSLTKKMLTKYLIESATINNINITEDYIDNIYITNAIMCARKGNNYRGDDIKLKECTLNCREYLKRQIEIVKPKVIMTLGYYPLLSLAGIYGFMIPKTMREVIEYMPVIKMDDLVIVPIYHPTAQVSKERQIEQYKRIWEYAVMR
ncbi:MAG: hypothetical protein K2L98_04660 [Bacilli bacterium]|nr:hypothetical protein [Bacilli bacterium]